MDYRREILDTKEVKELINIAYEFQTIMFSQLIETDSYISKNLFDNAYLGYDRCYHAHRAIKELCVFLETYYHIDDIIVDIHLIDDEVDFYDIQKQLLALHAGLHKIGILDSPIRISYDDYLDRLEKSETKSSEIVVKHINDIAEILKVIAVQNGIAINKNNDIIKKK